MALNIMINRDDSFTLNKGLFAGSFLLLFFFSAALTSLILKSLDPICYVNCVSSASAAALLHNMRILEKNYSIHFSHFK